MFLNYDLSPSGGCVQLRLSLRRRVGGRADGRGRAHLAVGADRPLHRHGRRGLGVKAVYVDKRELKCACVGGSSNVPSGSSRSPRT